MTVSELEQRATRILLKKPLLRAPTSTISAGPMRRSRWAAWPVTRTTTCARGATTQSPDCGHVYELTSSEQIRIGEMQVLRITTRGRLQPFGPLAVLEKKLARKDVSAAVYGRSKAKPRRHDLKVSGRSGAFH